MSAICLHLTAICLHMTAVHLYSKVASFCLHLTAVCLHLTTVCSHLTIPGLVWQKFVYKKLLILLFQFLTDNPEKDCQLMGMQELKFIKYMRILQTQRAKQIMEQKNITFVSDVTEKYVWKGGNKSSFDKSIFAVFLVAKLCKTANYWSKPLTD